MGARRGEGGLDAVVGEDFGVDGVAEFAGEVEESERLTGSGGGGGGGVGGRGIHFWMEWVRGCCCCCWRVWGGRL